MPYRAMALVAASLLIATQCYAKPVNTSKSNTYRQGSASSGGGAGVATINNSKSNTFRMGGGGGGKGATQRAKNLNTSRSNVDRMGGGGGGKGATGPANAVKLNTSRSN